MVFDSRSVLVSPEVVPYTTLKSPPIIKCPMPCGVKMKSRSVVKILVFDSAYATPIMRYGVAF